MTESKQSMAQRHSNFYFFGKYLVAAVNCLGFNRYVKSELNPQIRHFYHGIDKELYFKNCRSIHCFYPLSTSSKKSVAVNFANHNKGLIVQLSTGDGTGMYYCPVSWLSDFANECEHLFMGSDLEIGFAAVLDFENIIHPSSGLELKCILTAINILSDYFSGKRLKTTCDSSMQALVKALVENEIYHYSHLRHYKLCKPMNSLHLYARKLFHFHFWFSGVVAIDFEMSKKCFLNELFHSNDWINIDLINALFSGMKVFIVYNTDLCDDVMEYILSYLTNRNHGILYEIWLSNKDHRKIVAALCKYRSSFLNIGWFLEDYNDSIPTNAKICNTNILIITKLDVTDSSGRINAPLMFHIHGMEQSSSELQNSIASCKLAAQHCLQKLQKK
eukprot:233698_1